MAPWGLENGDAEEEHSIRVEERSATALTLVGGFRSGNEMRRG